MCATAALASDPLCYGDGVRREAHVPQADDRATIALEWGETGTLFRGSVSAEIVASTSAGSAGFRRCEPYFRLEFTIELSWTGSNGFSNQRAGTSSRKRRARGVKAPPVRNTTTPACSGANSQSAR